jgi:hypothetical protein
VTKGQHGELLLKWRSFDQGLFNHRVCGNAVYLAAGTLYVISPDEIASDKIVRGKAISEGKGVVLGRIALIVTIVPSGEIPSGLPEFNGSRNQDSAGP